MKDGVRDISRPEIWVELVFVALLRLRGWFEGCAVGGENGLDWWW